MIRRMTRANFTSSVSTKLFILTFLSVIVLFLIIALFGYQRLFEPIKQNNEKALQGSVVQVENYIKTLMNSMQTQLIFLSNPVLYNKMDAADYSLLIDNIMTFHQNEIHAIYLIENDKVHISSPYGYRFYVSPARIAEIKLQTGKTGFWWSPPQSVNERPIITVSKQIDSNRFVALDVNLDALTGPQIIQGE